MENVKKSIKRRWWIAGLFSYLVPGLGQVYNGQATKGLFFNFLFTLWGGVVFSFIFHMMKQSISRINIAFLFIIMLISVAAHLCIIIEAIKTSQKRKMENGLKPYNRWIIYLVVVAVSLTVDYSLSNAVKENIIKPFCIPTGSMEPTLLAGDYLLSNQLYFSTHNPARGEVVIMRYPRNEKIVYIKRIIGMPGDTLEIINKKVYINHHEIDEPYIRAMDPEVQFQISVRRDNYGPVIIPSDEYFVMGDYRDNSLDSRAWGTVKRHQIIGKPVFIYWSWDGTVPAWNIFRKWVSIRLGRIGHIIE